MEITEYLNSERINYELYSHRPAFTSQQMAAEEHIPGMNVAKPVIVLADGKYYMCVLPACCKVDLEVLRSQLGANKVTLASEEEMAGLFPDCDLGAEPPFGNVFGLATLMDESLSSDEYIVCQAGRHNRAVRIGMRDYKELVSPQVLSFSYRLH
jgi:Ala-tRNA(Pro) deacylase